MTREQLYRALVFERFRLRPGGLAVAVPAGVDAPTSTVIPRTPPAPDPVADVARMAGYGWTGRQISAVLAVDVAAVVRILARLGGPARVADVDVDEVAA